MILRKCKRCHKEKPLDKFPLSKNSYLGHTCLDCKENGLVKSESFGCVNIKLKVKKADYHSIYNKALHLGYSAGQYILFLHRKNIKEKKNFVDKR